MTLEQTTKLDLLIEGVKEKLKELSYSIHAQRSYGIYLNNIRRYAIAKRQGEFTEKLGANFLNERYCYPFKPIGRLCTTVQNASRTVDLLSTGEFFRRKHIGKERVPKNDVYYAVIMNY